tara:strand:- start:338 stop:694 length:357 start_codon:yes stop_codon:yes gene_type:complete
MNGLITYGGIDMVIARTVKGTAAIGAVMFNSKIYKWAKRRGVWYYRLFLSEKFSAVISDIYDMNQLEEKWNKLQWKKGNKSKKIFQVDEEGHIYDNATGEIYGNMEGSLGSMFDKGKP